MIAYNRWAILMGLVVATWLFPFEVDAAPRRAGLKWDAGANRVDGSIPGWPLTQVLARIAGATGWEVYVEPDSDRPIQASFTNLPPVEALRRLLGGLNFSLQPQPTGAARLYIYSSDRDRATQRIVAEDTRPGRIANELIVRLKPGSALSIEEIAKKVGARILGKLPKLNAYRLQFDSPEAAEAARKLIAELTDVAAVEDNYRWEAPTTLEAGTGTPASAPALKPKLSPDGKYLVVGIIDTAAQAMSPDREAFVLSRTDLVAGKPADDGLWHGTAMAEELLRGLSMTDTAADGSSVRLRLYNTYGANESATSFDVTRAVFQAAEDGVTVLNLSLGGPDPSPMLQESLRSFAEQGGLVFVAAGNAGTSELYFPAADPSVIAVTAVNRDGDPMSWANWGSYVDVGAPGVTTLPWGGLTWRVTGTSPASALVAGMAAGYADRTGVGLNVVRGVILREMPFTPKKP
ncbi:MAG TPA: S8 family serine peptidase [Verrucomicrobiota bacterium]|nr:hypothetical protein [Verrucomicrobiales bacterium]HRI11907.1 S8 family serine peptidase [Verrucomicrobiota bacterium]